MQQTLALGPMVRISGVTEKLWRGSILVSSKGEVPVVHLNHAEKSVQLAASKLDTVRGRTLWRYDVELPRGDALAKWKFQIQGRAGSIPVPGTADKVHFAFGSCLGFHDEETAAKMGGVQAVPDYLMRRYESSKHRPLHALLLGGDQIYCDAAVETLPTIKEWLKLPHKERQNAPFTEEMRAEVEKYYDRHYRAHFNNPALARLFANLPFHATWDDHDIFDGWGSYDYFDKAVVTKEIYKIARRYYLLYQQHTTEERAAEEGFIGETAKSSILPLAGDTSAVFIDTRSTRTKEQILPKEEWDILFENVEKHLAEKRPSFLFVVCSVPVIYPGFGVIETVLDKLNKYDITQSRFLQMLLGRHALNPNTGEVELLDDMVDHWKSSYHKKERDAMLERFHDLARKYNVRILLGSGDVHAMGYGESRSEPALPPRSDPRFIPQIISSAMANEPIASIVLKILRRKGKKWEEGAVGTVEAMCKLNPSDGSKPKSLFAQRGVVTVRGGKDGLRTTWHLEREDDTFARAQVTTPRLEAQA